MLDSEQQLEDVKLLIKPCYTDSYTHDGGQLLPLETRLWLALRADALAFVEAVEQVVDSLPVGLDFAGALKCATDLPPALESHPRIGSARRGMVEVLAKGIEARIDKEPNKIHGTMPLRDDVKQLSRGVFKRLLASDALQLQLENEAYSLMLTWLRRSPHVPDDAQRLALFKELAPLLRYHHMTPDFLANVVSVCNMMNKSDLLLSVLRSAFVHREASQLILEKEKVERVGGDRGVVPFEASWELKASYTLREMAVLQLGCWMKKWCGLIAGYPAGLSLQR